MDKYRQIAELLKSFQQAGQVFFSATVESIEERTCTVKVGSLPIPNVRLKPTTESTEEEILLTPKIGSNVLVGSFTGELSNLFVLQADSLSEAYFKVGSMSFKMDKNGINFNEGKNKGVVNVKDMVTWMKAVYADLQTLKTLLATSPIAGNGASAAIVFTPTVKSPEVSSFEDKNVIH